VAKSPLEQVKEKFGDKTKLVAAIRQLAGDELWLNRSNESKGLDHVSNSKLLKLHTTFSAVKDAFGSRGKLVSAITELEGRTKDEGYGKRLSAWPVPRLYDHFRSAKKRLEAARKAAEAKKAPAEGAAAKPKVAKATKAPAAKKATAKAKTTKAPAAKKKTTMKPAAAKAAAAKKKSSRLRRADGRAGSPDFGGARRPDQGPSTNA
jgi:hypothetical protein